MGDDELSRAGSQNSVLTVYAGHVNSQDFKYRDCLAV